MTHTPTGPLVFPGVYQLEQGASITDTGNALTLERRRTLYTPLHYTGRWAAKLGRAEQHAA
jgi:hypothetical protein